MSKAERERVEIRYDTRAVLYDYESGHRPLRVVVWPFVVLFLVVRFRASLVDFLSSLGELTFKAAGIEATAKRQQVEAAAALGAALARRPADAGTPSASLEDAKSVASIVAEAAKPGATRRLRDTAVLWVDDRPDNNRFERQALEALGVRFVLSTSTDDALQKLSARTYDVIISDMGRPPDPRAGYTLLDSLRKRGDQTPFIIYAGSNAPEHKGEAQRHGALGSTNRADELFELVLSAILESGWRRRPA